MLVWLVGVFILKTWKEILRKIKLEPFWRVIKQGSVNTACGNNAMSAITTSDINKDLCYIEKQIGDA